MREISIFENLVYEATKKIPKGQVSTYTLVASYIGHPKAQRAVGSALNKNPYAPSVPCHRVIRGDGSIGGFVSSTQRKMAILKEEGVVISSGYILNFNQVLFKFDD